MSDGRPLAFAALAALLAAAQLRRGSKGVVRAAPPISATDRPAGKGWIRPIIVKGRYGVDEKILPDNPIWSLPADNEDVHFEMKQRGMSGIVTSVRGLAVDGDGRIWGLRTMSGPRQDGHQMEGRVSIQVAAQGLLNSAKRKAGLHRRGVSTLKQSKRAVPS